MNALIDYMASHGAMLLFGVTTILGAATLTVLVTRQPVWKQRVAEVSVVMTIAWSFLAIVPMPRAVDFGWPWKNLGSATETDWAAFVATSSAGTNAHISTAKIQRTTATMPFDDDLRLSVSNSKNSVSGTTDRHSTVIPDSVPGSSSGVPSLLRASTIMWTLVVCGGGIAFGLIFARLMLTVSRRRCNRPDAWLTELYSDLPKSRSANVLVSHQNLRPMSFGFVRPAILLPVAICQPNDPQLLLHVLRHEQTHVDRRDAIGHAILNCSMPILWFHPLYWFLRSTATYTRELIADDRAASQGKKVDYVNALLGLVTRSDLGRQQVAGAIGILGLRHPFTRRMNALLRREAPLDDRIGFRRSVGLVSSAAVVTLSLATLFGVAPIAAQEPPQAAPISPPESSVVEPDQIVNEPKNVASEADVPVTEADDSRVDKTDTIKKSLRGMSETLTSNGIVRATQDLYTYAPDDSVVKAIHVKAGSTVKKGQLLFELANPDLQQAFRAATLDFEIAKLNLRGVHNGETEMMIRQAELNRSALSDKLSRLDIFSPIDGVVDDLLVNTGEPVTKSDKLCEIIGLKQIRIDGDVPSDLIQSGTLIGRTVLVRVRLGRDVNRTVALEGKVVFVSNKVDLNFHHRVWVECDNVKQNGHWLIKPGLMASVAFDPNDTGEKNIRTIVGSPAAKHVALESTPQENSEEIVLLKELEELHTAITKYAKLGLANGIGTVQEAKSADASLMLTKARLARAERDSRLAMSCYKQAIESAEIAAAAQLAEFQSGNCASYEVVRMNQLTTEIKLELARYRKQHTNP